MPTLADLPEEYSPPARNCLDEARYQQAVEISCWQLSYWDQLRAMVDEHCGTMPVVRAPLADALKQWGTLTVRAPYFQEQLEAVKADSSSHSDQPLPVAAPKQALPHWTQAAATPVAAPVSLSLPRAWEMRK